MKIKMSEWQGGSGQWYCNDIQDLAGSAWRWWLPGTMMNMSPSAYVEWLIKNYKPDVIKFDGKLLIYSWNPENYNRCHSFVLAINKYSRNSNFTY